MTTATSTLPDTPQPHRFSTEDYLRMIETGVLGPDDKVELIHGIISDMTPAGTRHHETLRRLNDYCYGLRDRFAIAIQSTTIIADGQVFDPDAMLLTDKSYWDEHPAASDIHLVVEVSDSSIRRDLSVKLPIYAAAGIAEYWVADCNARVMHVHREPAGDRYTSVQTLTGEQTVAPLAAPDHPLRVGDIFG